LGSESPDVVRKMPSTARGPIHPARAGLSTAGTYLEVGLGVGRVVSGGGLATNDALMDQEGAVDGTRKERRGFASMSREKQREIASKGGRAAHEKGTAHEWTPDEARAAGRKGGQSSRGGRGRLVPISSQEEHNLQVAPGTGREPGRAE